MAGGGQQVAPLALAGAAVAPVNEPPARSFPSATLFRHSSCRSGSLIASDDGTGNWKFVKSEPRCVFSAFFISRARQADRSWQSKPSPSCLGPLSYPRAGRGRRNGRLFFVPRCHFLSTDQLLARYWLGLAWPRRIYEFRALQEAARPASSNRPLTPRSSWPFELIELAPTEPPAEAPRSGHVAAARQGAA